MIAGPAQRLGKHRPLRPWPYQHGCAKSQWPSLVSMLIRGKGKIRRDGSLNEPINSTDASVEAYLQHPVPLPVSSRCPCI